MSPAVADRALIDVAAVDAMLASVTDLPTIPETLIEILNVIDDPDSGAADLARAVRRDAPLMAKILKLANSPYYSPRGDIGDIDRCVAVLGYRTVRQVAICVQVAAVMVKAAADAGGHLDYRELWRHAVVTASIAKHLARGTGYPDPEEVFTAGLLHDIGKFVLELHAPDRYAGVIAARGQRSLVEAELEAFGCDHARLGEAFAGSWRFPAVLVAAAGRHHEPADDDGDEARAVALVRLADYLANTMEPPRSDLGFDPQHAHPARLHREAGVDMATVENSLPELQEEIRRAAPFFNLI
ncbi:HDOD domain-containing protein [bacterium]|nr:HDOD domain-containing protein [bacterium]